MQRYNHEVYIRGAQVKSGTPKPCDSTLVIQLGLRGGAAMSPFVGSRDEAQPLEAVAETVFVNPEVVLFWSF